VRGCVDPQRHPAEDRYTGGSQAAPEVVCDLEAIGGCLARTHQCDWITRYKLEEPLQATHDVKHRRWACERGQPSREVAIAPADCLHSHRGRAVPHFGNVEPTQLPTQHVPLAAGDGSEQVSVVQAKHGLDLATNALQMRGESRDQPRSRGAAVASAAHAASA
jgi:hypothetical protein